MSTGGPKQSQDLSLVIAIILCNSNVLLQPSMDMFAPRNWILVQVRLHRMVPVTNIVHKWIESVRRLLYYKCNLK